MSKVAKGFHSQIHLCILGRDNNYCTMKMDELSFWNKALTPAEVITAMNHGNWENFSLLFPCKINLLCLLWRIHFVCECLFVSENLWCLRIGADTAILSATSTTPSSFSWANPNFSTIIPDCGSTKFKSPTGKGKLEQKTICRSKKKRQHLLDACGNHSKLQTET